MGISTGVLYLITIKIYTPSFATVNCIIECIPSRGRGEGRLFSFLRVSLVTCQPPLSVFPHSSSSTPSPSFHAAEGVREGEESRCRPGLLNFPGIWVMRRVEGLKKRERESERRKEEKEGRGKKILAMRRTRATSKLLVL